jgi:FAD synthase
MASIIPNEDYFKWTSSILSEKKPNFPDGLALCLGTFDGLHQGHQRLIIEACFPEKGKSGCFSSIKTRRTSYRTAKKSGA